jgi:protein-tyrosine-phosphatase
VASAGLGTWNGQAATEEAVAVLLEKGLDLRSHRSQPVTPQLVAGSDLILTMEPGQADTLRCAYPEAQERVFGLQGFAGREGKVADPYAHLGTAEVLDVYRATRDELSEAIEAAWPRLCEFLNLKKGEGQL